MNNDIITRNRELLGLGVITPNEYADSFVTKYLWHNGVAQSILAMASLSSIEVIAIVSRMNWIRSSGFQYTPFVIGGEWSSSDIFKLRVLLESFYQSLVDSKYLHDIGPSPPARGEVS